MKSSVILGYICFCSVCIPSSPLHLCWEWWWLPKLLQGQRFLEIKKNGQYVVKRHISELILCVLKLCLVTRSWCFQHRRGGKWLKVSQRGRLMWVIWFSSINSYSAEQIKFSLKISVSSGPGISCIYFSCKLVLKINSRSDYGHDLIFSQVSWETSSVKLALL